ncbi:MAG: iron-only hydrogenase system regulator [Lachnospiraceae bacterium]|nr:iron-only hydrogenase system regulator [Lachnospiraceae bacterium]
MKTRIAVISIIVEDNTSTDKLNQILSEYRDYIIARMGIPYKKGKVNLITVAIDATEDVINSLSGKVGRLDGVSAKTNYSNVYIEDCDN